MCVKTDNMKFKMAFSGSPTGEQKKPRAKARGSSLNPRALLRWTPTLFYE